MSKFRVRQRGQDLAEYALIIPFFLLIVFATFDLGRAVYAYSVIQNSAREGARWGIVQYKVPDWEVRAGIVDIVKTRSIGLHPDDIGVDVLPNPISGDTITVRVNYQFKPVTPFAHRLLGLHETGEEAILIHSQSVMQREE